MNLRKNWRDCEMAKIVKFSDYAKGACDEMQSYHFQTLAYDAIRYEDYISGTGKKQLEQIQKLVSDASLLNDPTIDSNKIVVLRNYMEAAKGVKKQGQNVSYQQENGKVLTRTPLERRAGFINASILLYAIMNIAIIIAITVFLL